MVDEALALKAPVMWIQLGLRDDAAPARAEAAGARVGMDRCAKIEYGRRFGEIGWRGVHRRVISAETSTARQLSGGGRAPTGIQGESSS